MVLLDPETHVEVISAADSIQILIEMLQASEIACHLIHIQPEAKSGKIKHRLPSPMAIRSKPELLLVKKCDALAKMSGKPTNLEALKTRLPIFCNLRIYQISRKQDRVSGEKRQNHSICTGFEKGIENEKEQFPQNVMI